MSNLKLWLFTALAGIGLILSAAEQDRYELRFQKSVAPAGGAGEVGRLRFDSELYDAVGDLKAELRFYDAGEREVPFRVRKAVTEPERRNTFDEVPSRRSPAGEAAGVFPEPGSGTPPPPAAPAAVPLQRAKSAKIPPYRPPATPATGVSVVP